MEWEAINRGSVRFEVRGVDCYLPVDQVREVLIAPVITGVFRSPPFVHGVVNIRGEVVPVLDLGILLGIGRRGLREAPRMLVLLDADDAVVALTSGGEVGVRQIDREELSPPPVDLSIDATDCVLGVIAPVSPERGPGLLLDGPRILTLSPLDALRSGVEQA